MKKVIMTLGIAAIAVVSMSFIKAAKNVVYKVDAEKSVIVWTAKKVGGQHTGTLKLNGGEVTLNGSSIKSGVFNIDMNTLTTTDLQGEWADKLIGHLKSEDFFSVEKNPTASFTVTKINAVKASVVKVTGNLTIKGITQPISFNATTKAEGSFFTASAKGVVVDRTKYDIRYGSKSFFASIGDKAIDDEFTLDITLVAKK